MWCTVFCWSINNIECFDSELGFSVIDFREEEHFSLGGRFSKSSTERESILEARKESLLAHARRFVYMMALIELY